MCIKKTGCFFAVLFALVFFGLRAAVAVLAYDFEANADVDLLCPGVPEAGDEIEVFDFRSGDYREVLIESRKDRQRRIDLVVSDSETGVVRKLQIREPELKKLSGKE